MKATERKAQGVRVFAGACGAVLAALMLMGCQKQPVEQAHSPSNPEPGLSGGPIPGETSPANPFAGPGVYPQPYFEGVRVVGHSERGGMQMGWIGHCAYLAMGGGDDGGIAVVDVSDPAAPRDVQVLTDPGASAATEAFDARETLSGRAIVIGGDRLVGGRDTQPSRLSIYDASGDCTKPRHMAEFTWPEPLHTMHISPDGMLIYGAYLEPMADRGGIHVLDISDMANPRYLGKFGATGADGRTWEFTPHNVVLSPDGQRLYAATMGSTGGDMNQDFTTPLGEYSIERFGPRAGGVYVFDSSDFAQRRPNPQLRVIGLAPHAGWHDVTLANINGAPHLVGTGEGLVPCPGAFPAITNISDLAHPRVVGEFRTDMNRPENCPPIPPGPPSPEAQSRQSSHFSSVDSETNTRLGLFSMSAAGYRIADLQDPANPREIAYFRPGPRCSGFSRYVAETGHIWMSCGAAGFYVLELTPEVKAAL